MGKELTEEEYQEYVSEGIVNDATVTASFSLSKLYSKNTFTHPSKNGDKDVTVKGIDGRAIIKAIYEQEKLLDKGDLSSLENMLFSQTHVLNAVMSNMACNMADADTLKKLETYGRLALKAQNQARQTISTLAEIKGIKKTTFVHQVNNAHNQQVNNGASENSNNLANEKGSNNVDSRSEAERARADSKDKAVVALERKENAGGGSTLSPECIQARDEVSTNKRATKAVS